MAGRGRDKTLRTILAPHPHPHRRLDPRGQSVPLAGRRAAQIWSYGHRNPQGLPSMQRGASCRPTSMVRRAAISSISFYADIASWPLITYGTDYRGLPIGNGERVKPGLEQPVHYWAPFPLRRPASRSSPFLRNASCGSARSQASFVASDIAPLLHRQGGAFHRASARAAARRAHRPERRPYVLTDGQEGSRPSTG